MDLSILGASQSVYQLYCNAIRKEYKNIPWLLYKRGRKRFLQETLKRTHIFLTKEYQDRYEKQARMNMQEELNGL
jgi:predicted metal-dependent HD superfamily phosphohydrolase